MATFYNGGLIKAHDTRFGISHKYITPKLTKNNWDKRAIVRGGVYIYVNNYQKYDGKSSHRRELVYKINGIHDGHKCYKDYKTLNSVLRAANNIEDGVEGEYPKERCAPVRIFSPIIGTQILTAHNKDLLKKRRELTNEK